ALNAEIVGISVDPPERNLAWTKQLGLPFRLLSDVDAPGRVSRLYGVWDDTWNLSKRVTFIVDRAGRIRFVEIGSLAIETRRKLAGLQQLCQRPYRSRAGGPSAAPVRLRDADARLRAAPGAGTSLDVRR